MTKTLKEFLKAASIYNEQIIPNWYQIPYPFEDDKVKFFASYFTEENVNVPIGAIILVHLWDLIEGLGEELKTEKNTYSISKKQIKETHDGSLSDKVRALCVLLIKLKEPDYVSNRETALS